MSDPLPERPTATTFWCWGVVLVTIVACYRLAGWPAALLSGLASLSLLRSTMLMSSLSIFGSSTVWTLAMVQTGDRRLFFAFTCWLATWAFIQQRNQRYWTGVLTAMSLLAVFFLIRFQQGASGRVLWFELVVSISLGGLAVVLESVVPDSRTGNWIAVLSVACLAAASVFL